MMYMSYRKGRSFEYYVREKFAKKGFLSVRASSSKGTPSYQPPIDIVAIRDGKVVLIECKKNKKSITKKLISLNTELGKKYGAESIIVYKDNGRVNALLLYTPYKIPLSRKVFGSLLLHKK